MRKQLVQLFGLALLISACSGKTYQALQWKEKPVAIDGHQGDWGDFLRYFDKDSKMFYEIGNDQQDLYFAVSTRDQSSQMKIMQKGLTFGIDLSASKNYPILLQFPYAAAEQMSNRPADSLMMKGQEPHPQMMRSSTQLTSTSSPGKEYRAGVNFSTNKKIFVTGFFSEVEDSVLELHNPYGIEVSMQLKDSTLFVEGKIPFQTFYKEVITSADTLVPINFEFLLSALDKTSSKSESQSDKPDGPPSGGNMGMSSHGDGPGGMPSGGGMGRPGGHQGSMSDEQKISGNGSGESLDYDQKEIKLMMRLSLKE